MLLIFYRKSCNITYITFGGIVLAQSSGNKKKTSSGSSSTKKKSNASSKKNQQLTFSDLMHKKEFTATLSFVIGLLLLIIALFSGGNGSLWNSIHVFYFSVFGICGYYLPLAVLFFSVVVLLNKQSKKYYIKAIEILILFVLISSVFFVTNIADADLGFGANIKNVYEEFNRDKVISLDSGGIIGAFFGGIIFQICKSVLLSNLILIVLIVADIMVMFGITLVKVLIKMEKPAKKVGKFTEEALVKSKNDIANRIKSKDQESGPANKQKDVDPSRIVNDFYDNNDDKENENDSNSEPEVFIDTKEPDLFTFAEIFSAEKDNASSAEKKSEREKSTEETNCFTCASNDDSSFVENVNHKDNKEKAVPLTEEESQELIDSLDNGLANEIHHNYILPPLDCLNKPKTGIQNYNEAELKSNGEKLIAALNSFNVSATIVGVVPGPSVTRYELSPAPGVKISKFVGLADDLALHMAAPSGLRIEAPIPNKAAIGIEIPNRNKTTVTFRESIDNDKFRESGSKLTVALGKDIAGSPMFSNLSKMPHLLVAGTTGSGKSVCLNSMIVSLLYNATPDEVKLLLIDPKQVEFGIYNGLPHLLVPVVSDPRKAAGALGWAVTEMLSRYKTLNANGVRDIAAYNSLCDEREDLQKLPHIVIFIDELADLMTVAPSEVEDSIQRLAQMARAAGMHLVVATQRPSVDVITGVIKSNIPSRIALTVKSYVDSKIIIDTGGAEKLMGNGDMLYYPVGVPKPVRIQGCYLSDSEIENVVEFIKANSSSNYDDSVQQEIDRQAVAEKKKSAEESNGGSVDSTDDLLMRAIELFVSAPEKASISALQRHLGLGFAKAGRLMDTLEQKGVVGPHMGSKPRNVLITKAQWYEMNAMLNTVADNSSVQEASASEGE